LLTMSLKYSVFEEHLGGNCSRTLTTAMAWG
jgi:hypothetical protein